MNETAEYCPMCENHCSVSDLRCGRGRAHLGLARDGGGQEDEHRRCGLHQGRHRGRHKG